ncbi:MAG: cytochrome c biogenesis protein CcdA [Bauldia litoralis]
MFELSNIGLLTAFAAGTISFLSPCVLPLVPGYISYIAGGPGQAPATGSALRARLPAIGLSINFVLGFTTVFVVLGASATALGQLLIANSYELTLVAGAVVMAFGVVMMGAFRPGWLLRDWRYHVDLPGGRPIYAYVLGLAFAFGWTPCIGPILGAILTVSATGASVADGVALLAIYSMGLGVPFLATAVFADGLTVRLKRIRRLGAALQVVAGGVLVLMGLAMITGRLAEFSYWMLDLFPALGRIG